MSIINAMPALLEELDDPPPLYVQYGFAFYTLRTMLGRGKYDAAEDRIVWNLYHAEAQQAGQDAVERRQEYDTDAPRIRAHYLQEVNRVLAVMLQDGSCRVHTRRGAEWSTSPAKIALELDTLPSVVRAAQEHLRKQKAG